MPGDSSREDPGVSRSWKSGKRPRVLAHRGAAGLAPENTLVSFQQALLNGCDILEMDVHLTNDGHIVVCHDATVDRTTSGHGRIKDLTLAQVKALDAGFRFRSEGLSGFPFRGQGITIPTLEEVLQQFPHLPLNIEVKVGNSKMLNALLDVLGKYGRLQDGSVMVSMYAHKPLAKIRRLAPLLLTNYSRREIAALSLRARFRRRPRASAHPRAFQVPMRVRRAQTSIAIVTPAFVRFAHALGAEVHVWTINDEAQMKLLLQMGVDGIFTDYPDRLRKLLDAAAAERTS